MVLWPYFFWIFHRNLSKTNFKILLKISAHTGVKIWEDFFRMEIFMIQIIDELIRNFISISNIMNEISKCNAIKSYNVLKFLKYTKIDNMLLINCSLYVSLTTYRKSKRYLKWYGKYRRGHNMPLPNMPPPPSPKSSPKKS